MSALGWKGPAQRCPAALAAERLRIGLEHCGVSADVHEGHGVALVWTNGHAYRWWTGKISAKTGRRVYRVYGVDNPVTVATTDDQRWTLPESPLSLQFSSMIARHVELSDSLRRPTVRRAPQSVLPVRRSRGAHVVTLLDECLSPHVAMPQRDHLRLDWREPYPALERTPSVARTCWCRATVYELCEGAGRAFVRRTIQLDSGHQVQETLPRPIDEARVIWMALLSGPAR